MEEFLTEGNYFNYPIVIPMQTNEYPAATGQLTFLHPSEVAQAIEQLQGTHLPDESQVKLEKNPSSQPSEAVPNLRDMQVPDESQVRLERKRSLQPSENIPLPHDQLTNEITDQTEPVAKSEKTSKRPRKNDDVLKEALQCMRTFLEVSARSDEHITYGEYIAQRLRTCNRSEPEILTAKKHIAHVVYNLSTGLYKRTGGANGVRPRQQAVVEPYQSLEQNN